MKTPLWKISVSTTLEAEDAVMELLGRIAGGNPSAYFDLEKQASLVSTFSPCKIRSGTQGKVKAALEEAARCGLDVGPGKVRVGRVRREDWAESWKRHFRPLDIGGTLLVKPSWSKRRARPAQKVVILDPGLSFGTGQHPTTSFCLGQIVRFHRKFTVRHRQPSFLDIGTGSGILAIAAAKLGYQPVEAFDFDPEAVRIAQANAKNNGICIPIYRGDVAKLTERRRFHLVCANLMSNLLIAERKRIAAQLDSDGVLVLAGILRNEFSEVQKAFESIGLRLVSARSEKEWRSGSFSFA